ncbi:MAG: leucine-rich repeat protein [Clostridia bacterium]|nr:leucine-rich repeat protein [Clostridia bacterium]
MAEDLTVTAQWTINHYAITYNLDGGTNNENNPTTYTVEDEITLAAPSKTDYLFTGWSDNGVIAVGSTGEKTFTANWTPDPAVAKLVAINELAFDGTTLTLTVPNATATYSFLNKITVNEGADWQICTDEYGIYSSLTKTVPLSEGDNVFYLFVISNDKTNVLAYTVEIRRKPLYTVSFETNGGSDVASVQAEEGTVPTAPASAPTRAGYTFAGWDYDFATPIAGDLTVNANWTAIKYTITYNLGGGTNAENNPATYTVEDEITLAAPARADYTFLGWSDNGVIAVGSTGEKTFTANWKQHVQANEYTVDVAPTCSTVGSKSYHCTVCGEIIADTAVVIPIDPDAHVPANVYTVDLAPTCSTVGSKSYHCAECGTILPETTVVIPIDPDAHVPANEYTVDVAPTCSTVGSKSYHCTECGTILPDTTVVIPIDPDAHVWANEYTIDLAPTYWATGSQSIHCTLCDTVKPNSSIVIRTGNEDKWETVASVVNVIAEKDRSLNIACDISRNGVKTSKNDVYVAGPDSVEEGITPAIEAMVYERNEAAKDLLGLTITYDYWAEYYGQQAEKIDVLVKGNAADAPDLFICLVYDLNLELLNGTFKDVWSIPGSYFDFNAPGWLTDWMEGNSLTGDRAYVLGSDYFLELLRSVSVMPFNMDLMNENASKLAPIILNEGETLGAGEELTTYFFDLVEAGKWTFDVLGKLCEAIWVDVDGNGQDSIYDVLGIIADEYGGKTTVGFIYSCGTPITEAYTIENESSEYYGKQWIKYADNSEDAGLNDIFDAVSKVFVGMGSLSTNATHSSNTPEAPGKAYHLTKFAQDELLFLGVDLLGDLEDDRIQSMTSLYSVIPCPKVSVDGTYNTIIDNTGDAGAINVNANPRKARALSAYLQYCTEHSGNIRQEYLEIVTKYRITPYNQGTDRMLNIIYEGILYGRDKAVDDLFGVIDRPNRWHDLMKNEHHEGDADYITTRYAEVVSHKQARLDSILQTWYTLPKVEGVTPPFHTHTPADQYTVDAEPQGCIPGSKSLYCIICGKSIPGTAVEIPAPNAHTPADKYTVDTQPTCTEVGYKSYHCTVCGASISSTAVEIPAKGHVPAAEYTVEVAPTCSTTGILSYHCAVCGDVIDSTIEDIPIDPTLHVVTNWPVYKPATLLEDGRRAGECSLCHQIVEETLTYVPKIKKFTDTDSGKYAADTVSLGDVRGDKHFYPTDDNPDGNDLYVEFSILWNDSILNFDGSNNCYMVGHMHSKPFYYLSPVPGIPMSDSDFSGAFEWMGNYGTPIDDAEVDTPDGMCGFSANFSDYPNIAGPDQDNPEWGWHRVGIRIHVELLDGRTGEYLTDYYAVATGYVDGVAIFKLSTGTAGLPNVESKLFNAESDGNGGVIYCDADENTVIPFQMYHTKTLAGTNAYLAIADLSVTCGKGFVMPVEKVANPEGNTYTMDDGTEIPAALWYRIIPHNHVYGAEYTVDIPATCTTDGSKSYHCTVCGASKPDSIVLIPATGHNWEYVVDVEPTCTEVGYKSYLCTVCGESKPDSTVEIPATGHNWTYVVDVASTCSTTGSKSLYCTECNESKPDSSVELPIDPDTHVVAEWTVDKRPTLLENGSQHGVCLLCGNMVVRTIDQSEPIVIGSNWGTAERAAFNAENNVDWLDHRDLPGGIYIKRNVNSIKGQDQHYYPTKGNPLGNDLLVEVSYLWSEVMDTNYRGEPLTFGNGDGYDVFHVRRQLDAKDNRTINGALCQYEYVTPTPDEIAGNAALKKPSLGGYGWHRLSFRVHQDAEINGGAVKYTYIASAYVDGTLVLSFDLTDWVVRYFKSTVTGLLYTAEIENGELVYYDIGQDPMSSYQNSYGLLYFEEFFYSSGASTAYAVFGDIEMTCGHDFVQQVEAVENPTEATYTLPNGTVIPAAFWYRIKQHDHIPDDTFTVDLASTCTTIGYKSYHCAECGVILPETIVEIPIDPDAHTVLEWEITKPSTLLEDGLKTGVCTRCQTEVVTTYSGGSTVEKKYTTSATNEKLFVQQNVYEELLGNGTKHFYPTVENPDGLDLYVEYSLLWNETILNLTDSGNSAYAVLSARITAYNDLVSGNDLVWMTLSGNGSSGSDCPFAGGFEYGALRTVEVGPQGMTEPCGNTYDDFPNVGGSDQFAPEWGWHRIGVKFHMEVANEAALRADTEPGATPASYYGYVETYLDGVLISRLSKTGTNVLLEQNRLFTASSDGNGNIIYTDIPDDRYVIGIRIPCTRTLSGSAYVVYADYSATAGTAFVQEIERIENPATKTYTTSDGTEIPGTMWYYLKHDHVYDGVYTVDMPATCTTPGSKSYHCAVCDAINPDSVVAIQATGHTPANEYTVDLVPTCSSTGYKSYHCAECGEIIPETIVEIPADPGAHVVSNWTVTKQATLLEDGSAQAVCAICHTVLETVIGFEPEIYNSANPSGRYAYGADFAFSRTVGEIRGNKHFYPTQNDPDGNDLWFEYSFLWNDTLYNHDYSKALAEILLFGFRDSNNLSNYRGFYYLYTRDNNDGFRTSLDCPFMGHVDYSTYYPGCTPNENCAPDLSSEGNTLNGRPIGQYKAGWATPITRDDSPYLWDSEYQTLGGWHRLGFRYHQEAAIEEGELRYSGYTELYIDGVKVWKVLTNMEGYLKNGQWKQTDWSLRYKGLLLWTAEIDPNDETKLIYADNDALMVEMRIESITRASSPVYVVVDDIHYSCGDGFALYVERIDDPAPSSLVLAENVTVSNAIFFRNRIHDHDWNNAYTVDVEPTCTTNGSKSYHCTVCGAIQPDSSVVIPATGHNWEYVVDVASTCSTAGSKSLYCTECGEVQLGSSVEIPVTGHNWEYVVDVEPTCATAGSKSLYCTECGTHKRDSSVEIPADPTLHVVTDWTVTKRATLLENGIRVGICEICGEYVAEEEFAYEPTTWVYTPTTTTSHKISTEIDDVLWNNKHFYPDESNGYEGLDLIIEFSFLWNETLLRLNTGSNYMVLQGSLWGQDAYWMSLTDHAQGSDCVYAGGFEYISLRTVEYGPAGMSQMTANNNHVGTEYSDFPNIGGTDRDNPEWGWHRIAIVFHEEVLKDSGVVNGGSNNAVDAASYLVTSTCYIDGVIAYTLSNRVSDDYINSTFKNRTLLFRTDNEDAPFSYVDTTGVTINGIEIPVQCTSTGNAYVMIADYSVTAGKYFVQSVEKAENPEEKIYTMDDGTEIPATVWFQKKPTGWSEGLAFDRHGTGNVSGLGTCTDTDLVIPPITPDGEPVRSIGNRAFSGCTGLTSITIPDSVTSIGWSAFSGCSDLTVIIGSGITYIDEDTFAGCTGLTSVTLGNNVGSINQYAFQDCTGLTTVVVPKSLVSVDRGAFKNCTSLTSIIYEGTMEEWNAIHFWESNWNANTGDYVIHCSDGDIAK